MKIGVIGAMVEEIELMKKELHIMEEEVHAKIAFYLGTFQGKEIVLCKSGVGKVNAAITTQLLIDKYDVEKIIFTGVAGAVDPALNIGDIVISSSSQYHDIDASPLGFERGVIPMFEHPSVFLANNNLAMMAEKAATKLEGVNVLRGKVLSGDQFIANQEMVQYFYEHFEGKCVEMEGAAVAHVAMLNEIPYVIIRSISDKANGEANMSFNEFVELAAKNSNLIVQAMLTEEE